MSIKSKRRFLYALAFLCVLVGIPLFLYDYSPSVRFWLNTFVIGQLHTRSGAGVVASETISPNGAVLFCLYDSPTGDIDFREQTRRNRLVRLVNCADPNPPGIILSRHQDRYALFVPVIRGKEGDSLILKAIKDYGDSLSDVIFDNHAVEIHITDEFMNTLRVINIPGKGYSKPN